MILKIFLLSSLSHIFVLPYCTASQCTSTENSAEYHRSIQGTDVNKHKKKFISLLLPILRSSDPQRRYITSFKIVKSKEKRWSKRGITVSSNYSTWAYKSRVLWAMMVPCPPPIPEITISHFTGLIPKSHHHSRHLLPYP